MTTVEFLKVVGIIIGSISAIIFFVGVYGEFGYSIRARNITLCAGCIMVIGFILLMKF